jgi:hypothetical protein
MITTKSIDAVINKAIKRAEWYEQNYRYAKKFEKRKNKQFWNVLFKYNKKHELSIEDWQKLIEKVPVQFKFEV